MRLAVMLCTLAAAGLLLAGCGGDSNVASAEMVRSDAPRAPVEAAAGEDVSAAVEAFSAGLYASLSQREGNLVFSPYSVAVALAMTRAGATGETLAQMDEVLQAALAGDLDAGFNALEQALAQRPGEYELGDEKVELELATANQLFAQRDFPFEDAYLGRLAANYGAGVMLVDYINAREDARRAINGWVAERTRDRIPELIPDGVLTELTRLVLTNAIYLKAPWMHPFDEGGTESAAFERLDGSQTDVDMMRLGARILYGRGPGFQAVELPYVDGSVSMVVVVPDEGRFEDFEAGLDAAMLGAVVDSLGDAQVNLRLPRFEFRTQAMLKSALSDMGMPIAFTDDADFSAMSPRGEDLYIQEVVHEAFVSVDEEGTEAAAATAVVVGIVSAPEVQAELTVDRPFLFLIRDRETGALLFMGRVLDPSA